MVNTWENLDVAEKLKNHQWEFNQAAYDAKDKDGNDVSYNLAPKLDADVIDTQDHLKQQEKKAGKPWEIFKKDWKIKNTAVLNGCLNLIYYLS